MRSTTPDAAAAAPAARADARARGAVRARPRSIGFRAACPATTSATSARTNTCGAVTSEPEHWGGCMAGEARPRDRGRRQDQGLPVAADRPLQRRQRRATVSIRRRDGRAADLDARSDRSRPGFCGYLLLRDVCRGGCTWMTHGLPAARRQSVLPPPRARAGEAGPARAHREGRGGARRAVRFRPLRHRRGRSKRPARSRRTCPRRQEAPRGRKLDLCTGCREFIFASERICPHCGRRIGRERNIASPHPNRRCSRWSMKSTRMRWRFRNLSTDRRCRSGARATTGPLTRNGGNMASNIGPYDAVDQRCA